MAAWHAEANEQEQGNRPADITGPPLRFTSSSLSLKSYATLAAMFALLGRELLPIAQAGRIYFEVRRWNECFTVSSVADLHGLLRQFEAAAE